jgi:cytochrome c oxidase cbb3-type subunit III
MTAMLEPTAATARGRHRPGRRRTLLALLGVAPFLFVWSVSSAQEPAPHAATPDDREGREVFLRVCAKCHTAERVTAQGRTRAQWEEVMITMRTARAAMFTDDEFATVLDYLARAHGPSAPPPPASGRTPDPARRGPRAHVGAADRHRVDDAAADRGRKTYAAECVTCHGPSARGTGNPATNLIRSSLVLRDRYGSAIGPLLKKGHPTQSGALSSSLTDPQIVDLSHFVWQRINDTLQGSPAYEPKDVLTGDPTSGQAYFTGEGRCTACHSPRGDLAGYGRRYSPVDIQQRFVFPGANTGRGRGASRKPVTVTVSWPDRAPISGALVSLDDFHVALRDGQGEYRSWTRTLDMKIVKDDPLTAHVDLLYRLTDKTMHDVVAYLESLK